MKVKSLLFAAAACMAVGAMAQPTVTANTFSVTQDDLGKVFPLELTLHMDPDEALGVSGDFTNIQVNITFPEGLEPCMIDYDAYDEDGTMTKVDEGGVFTMEGPDLKLVKKVPCVSYTDNFDVPENWPTYDVVGANLSKTPNTTNPNHFLTIFCTTRGDKVVTGDRPFTAYVKYTQENDKSHAIGTPTEHFTLTTISFTGPSAVADVNAAKAVSSVKYYNAAGVASDNAFEGVNIVVTKYADGSQSVTKVVK